MDYMGHGLMIIILNNSNKVYYFNKTAELELALNNNMATT